MESDVKWKNGEPYCGKCDAKLQGEKGFWYKFCQSCGARTYWKPGEEAASLNENT